MDRKGSGRVDALWEILNWQNVSWLVVADAILVAVTIPWALQIKRESSAALAWCLLVLLLPLLGAVLFFLFGYQSVDRPLARKRRHRKAYKTRLQSKLDDFSIVVDPDKTWEGMGRLALRLGASPLTAGNAVTLYYEGPKTFDAMLAAIRAAEHHVHVEFYIFEYDSLGKEVLALLAEKAKAGVQVRLMYDAIGTRGLWWFRLRALRAAGGKAEPFLPINLLRRRLQVNLRNHRKLMVVDGKIGFIGGMNVGDEYRDKGKLTPWRDTMMRIDGPAVDALQRVFLEDWDFAAGEAVDGDEYYRGDPKAGDATIQILDAGPDQPVKGIREIYFAAIYKARKRLWIATPYYVPDQGLRDALCMAGMSGIDVRLMIPKLADQFTVHYATRYYLGDLLEAGVKVYQYTKGFIHAKVWIADDEWASVGSANFDNRSLLLNFEANALVYTAKVVKELADQFERDMRASIRLDAKVYAMRPWGAKVTENICRLFSPIL